MNHQPTICCYDVLNLALTKNHLQDNIYIYSLINQKILPSQQFLLLISLLNQKTLEYFRFLNAVFRFLYKLDFLYFYLYKILNEITHRLMYNYRVDQFHYFHKLLFEHQNILGYSFLYYFYLYLLKIHQMNLNYYLDWISFDCYLKALNVKLNFLED